MSLEIRPITEDEVERAEYIGAYSFNNSERFDMAPAVERAKRYFSVDWSLASFEDGEMTAFMRMLPFAFRINGRAIPFGGVGPVVSSPEHRRKGHVGALLRRSLEVMRERGQALSGLHTPHPDLYRRYGWEIATIRRQYTFPPKDVTLVAQPSERGRFRMLKADDWADADRVYRQHTAMRNSPIQRIEVWWREAIFSASRPEPADVALWENGRGEAEGYVVYRQPERPRPHEAPFWVHELVAITSDAYLNLIGFLVRHDLAPKITWGAPPDDPFLNLVDDTYKVNVEEQYDLMLRVCDVEAALKQRPPAGAVRTQSLTLAVTDSTAPWNEGTWRVEVANGASSVEKVSGEADIALSATVLAPVFNGFLSPTSAALAGLVKPRSEDALSAADEFFATVYPPFCADGF